MQICSSKYPLVPNVETEIGKCCFARVLLSLVSLGCCELRGFVRHVCLHPLPEPDHPREVGWWKGLLLSLENEHSIF